MPAASAHSPKARTVAAGLDNPRHLSFGPDGTLYVAESGRGGSGPCIASPEGGDACLGPSGAVTALRHGQQRRVVRGLPSLAAPDGSQAAGPSDVARHGNRRIAVTVGLGAPPADRAQLGRSGARLGTLLYGRVGSRLSVKADLAGFEGRHDPDGSGPDSNPSALVRHGSDFVVADAGGNDLLTVSKQRTSVAAVFPSRLVDTPPGMGLPPQIPMEAVPTGVATGRGGEYYVSQLTGFPFPPGGSTVWRVRPGGTPTALATGFTNVTDIEWASGTVYVVQLADAGLLATEGLPMGSLIEISPSGKRRTIADNLPAPYGVAVRHGKAYVTTCSVCAGGGEVRAIPLTRG